MFGKLVKLGSILLLTFCLTGFGSCSLLNVSQLDPNNPVTIEFWHYYNGTQQAELDKLITTYNETIGAEQGVKAVAVSRGNVSELTSAVDTAAATGAESLPDIIAGYPGTVCELANQDLLVNLSQYMTAEEKAAFKPEFLAEGHFPGDDKLYLLPIAKSSEVIALNITAWRKFAADNPQFTDPAAALATWESVAQAAEAYRIWSGGRSMIGFDSLANYLIIGSQQLGVDLFAESNGQGTVNLDRDVMRKLWDIYYVNTVIGGFAEIGDYRADDLANGDLIAGVLSTASGPWLPTQDIELMILPYPTFEGMPEICVQQGAGLAVIKSDSLHETAAASLLGWLVRPEQNVNFAVSSSYLPVTDLALQSQLLRDSLSSLAAGSPDQINTANCMNVFLDQMTNHKLYFPAAFKGSGDVRDLLEKTLKDTARAARKEWLNSLTANVSMEKLQNQYINDVAFEAWYSAMLIETGRILDQK